MTVYKGIVVLVVRKVVLRLPSFCMVQLETKQNGSNQCLRKNQGMEILECRAKLFTLIVIAMLIKKIKQPSSHLTS